MYRYMVCFDYVYLRVHVTNSAPKMHCMENITPIQQRQFVCVYMCECFKRTTVKTRRKKTKG